MSLSTSVNRLRRRAKLLSREEGIPLHQALNRVAKEEGYQSWSLLVVRNSSQVAAPKNSTNKAQITSLPLNEADRAEFIEEANRAFEYAIIGMVIDNPEEAFKIWYEGSKAEFYIDNLLTNDMLPIDRDYALSLVDPFLAMTVIDTAMEADG